MLVYLFTNIDEMMSYVYIYQPVLELITNHQDLFSLHFPKLKVFNKLVDERTEKNKIIIFSHYFDHYSNVLEKTFHILYLSGLNNNNQLIYEFYSVESSNLTIVFTLYLTFCR